MGYLKIKRRQGEGYWAVFVGCEYLGDVYFNGTTDLEVPKKMLSNLMEHGLTENHLLDVLEEEYSYVSYFSEPDEDGMEVYEEFDEDEDITHIETTYGDNKEIPTSIYVDAKNLKSEDLYGNFIIQKFKEEKFSIPDECALSPVVKYTKNDLYLKGSDESYQIGGKFYNRVLEANQKLEQQKIDLVGMIKSMLNEDMKNIIKSEELKEIDRQIKKEREDYLKIPTKYSNMTDDIRKKFCILSDESKILMNINTLMYRKTKAKENVNILDKLYHQFNV